MNKPVIYAGVIVLLVAVGIGLLAFAAHDGNGGGNATVNTTNETTMTVAAAKVVEDGPWNITGPGPVWKLYQTDDGTLYSFQGPYGNTIRAISPNGSIKWEYEVPGEWRVSNLMFRYLESWSYRPFEFIGPAFSIDGNTLYLYVRENTTTNFNHYLYEEHPGDNPYHDYLLKERLMAISNGQLLWDVPISNEHHSYEDSNVYAQNGRVYLFDDYSIKVFSDNGTMLFKIGNASSPPAVDEEGRIYVVPCSQFANDWTKFISYMYSIYQYTTFKEPAGIVEAYSPEGSLLWQKSVGQLIIRPILVPELTYQYDTLPLYHNHTLYVLSGEPSDHAAPNGKVITALDLDGNTLWTKSYDGSVRLAPGMIFDEQNRLYARNLSMISSGFHIISPNGSEITQDEYAGYGMLDEANASISLVTGQYLNNTYNTSDALYPSSSGTNLSDLSRINLSAYDMANDRILWMYDIAPPGTYEIISSDNADRLLDLTIRLNMGDLPNIDHNDEVASAFGNDTVYVYWKMINYQWPIVVNQTVCFYVSHLYAFDKTSGELLWQKPLDTLVTSMVADNDTFYYGTRDGKIFGGITKDKPEPAPVASSVQTDMGQVAGAVAGGAAVTAAAVIFIKAFGLGGFTRGRTRLAANDNRNKVLEYIVSHPGSTLHEISHGLGVNVGTIRYHLLVLAMNHRVTTFKSDGKYVRYFTNSGSYSKDEQFYLSLVRRDPIRKILNLLLDRTELSNLEISEALKMHDSATSRYMKELAVRGLVAKRNIAGGRTAYSLRQEYRDPVAAALERLGNDQF